jgi:hypothetical protein
MLDKFSLRVTAETIRGESKAAPLGRYPQFNRISTTSFGPNSKVTDSAAVIRGQQSFCGSSDFIST